VPKYSIVVPFHNEEENVTALYDRLKDVMEHVGESFELILVDDGSRDRTYRLMEEIAAVDSRILVIKLRRNFGQTSALAAGFDHAQGDYVLAMDGDLQHDPKEIPNFLAKLIEKFFTQFTELTRKSIAWTFQRNANKSLNFSRPTRHYQDTVRKKQGFIDLVRYQDHSYSGLIPNAIKELLHQPSSLRVQGSERLVHQNNFRLDNERT